MKYDVNQDVETMAAIRESFSGDLFSRSAGGFENAEPLFIVGLPRTGSTLVERILDSHSEVSSEGELQNFAVQLTKLAREAGANSPQGRLDLITASTTIDFRTLGERYIESTRPRTGRSSYFIDKMPLNFLYVGLIHLALPNATIIHVHRDPMDACYAIYKTLFRDAYPYSYALDDLAKYFAAYRELMEHWHRALPGRVFDLQYEDLVDHQEDVTRRLLDHCGLPFEQACLDFHEHKASSTTASASQIRQPIYNSSVGKWRHFRNHLEALESNLSADVLE